MEILQHNLQVSHLIKVHAPWNAILYLKIETTASFVHLKSRKSPIHLRAWRMFFPELCKSSVLVDYATRSFYLTSSSQSGQVRQRTERTNVPLAPTRQPASLAFICTKGTGLGQSPNQKFTDWAFAPQLDSPTVHLPCKVWTLQIHVSGFRPFTFQVPHRDTNYNNTMCTASNHLDAVLWSKCHLFGWCLRWLHRNKELNAIKYTSRF